MELINIGNRDGQLVVGSRQIAEHFGKEHKDVLFSIRSLMQGVAEKSADPLFIESEYQNEQNKQWYPEYLLTRDGFSLLVMGFTGQRALEWKLKYIEAFNQMERQLKTGPMSIDLIIATAQELKALELKQQEQERKLTAVVDEQKRIKGKVDILNDKEFTVMGYANIHSIHLNNKLANRLGRKAAKLSRDEGYPIGNATHPVFGRVNTYHTDILDVVFDEWEQ